VNSVAAVADATVSHPSDGTSVSVFHRVVRYTAAEEDSSTGDDGEADLINSAALTLPSSIKDKNITATGYIVKDLSTGSTALQYNADRLAPIASLTKLVTAEVARKLIPDIARIPITQQVMATYGNTADFRAGEVFTSSDLLYPMLMVSSNDAAEAYAQYYGRAAFIQAMNDFVQKIGAYRTYFADPSGLDPKNVSTPNDVSLILDWIRKNDPDVINMLTVRSKTIRSHTWVNTTHFLSWSYFIGGKNGYLPEANRTAALLFALGPNKDIYSFIVLGSSDRDSDVIKLLKKAEN
jgi:D-alanyl-D-alanine carboxypeptidase